MEKSSKVFGSCGCLLCVCGLTRGNHNSKPRDNQAYELHCGRFGCCQKCPKQGFHQSNHQGKVAELFCKKRDEN